MSKNISLSSAKAFPSSTPFNSRFGGLRPSFLKNRAHMWRFKEEALLTPEHTKIHQCRDSLTLSASSPKSQQDRIKLLPLARQQEASAAVCKEEGLSPYRSVADQISSVDVSLGRLTVSPHASFAFPQTHMQLLVKYTYPYPLSAVRRGDANPDGGAKDDEAICNDSIVMTAGEAIKESIVPFSQKAIRRFVRAQSQRAEERERHLKEKDEREKKKEADKVVQRTAIDSLIPQQSSKKTMKDKKSAAAAQPLLPSEALQCLEDDPAHCALFSKRINAWSLYAKARSLYAVSSCGGSNDDLFRERDGDDNHKSIDGDERGGVPKCEAASSLAIVMPTDCKVLPAAEGIAAQLPHRFIWLPIAASWEEAGPLAPDSPFRSTLHSQKPWPFASEAPPKIKAEGEHEGQQVDAEGFKNENGRESVQLDDNHRRHATSTGTCLPQQVVQLRALVPIVDPVIDCSLEAEVYEGESANPITSSIYSIIFSDSARMSRSAERTQNLPPHSHIQDLSSLNDDAYAGLDAPPLPSVAFLRARVRDLVVMPLVLSAAKRVVENHSITNNSSTEEGRTKSHDDDFEFVREKKMLERSILKVICHRGGGESQRNSGSAGGDPLVARLYIDKRKLMYTLGWGHCARWLGGVEMVVDGNYVRFV